LPASTPETGGTELAHPLATGLLLAATAPIVQSSGRSMSKRSVYSASGDVMRAVKQRVVVAPGGTAAGVIAVSEEPVTFSGTLGAPCGGTAAGSSVIVQLSVPPPALATFSVCVEIALIPCVTASEAGLTAMSGSCGPSGAQATMATSSTCQYQSQLAWA